MDIDILLGLQNMREGAPDIFTSLLAGLSLIADGPGLVAMVMVVYWCVSKRVGQFAITSFVAGNAVCQFLKNIFCLYRPWVRDPRVVPPDSVIEGAGGYSFPSGHTNGATTALGSFATFAWKRYRVLSIVLIVIIALIMFSRLYFGVHTPQDVLVGFGIGLLSIWLTSKFFAWMDENGDKDLHVVVIAIAVAIAMIVIVALKPYPLDYVNGTLLVDPVEMQKGSFEAAGTVIGVALGWFLERRRVQFSTDSADIDLRGRIVRGVVGVVIVGLVYVIGNALFKMIFGILIGKLIAMALITFAAMYVVPLAFGFVERMWVVPYGSVTMPSKEDFALPAGRGHRERDERDRERGRDERGGRDGRERERDGRDGRGAYDERGGRDGIEPEERDEWVRDFEEMPEPPRRKKAPYDGRRPDERGIGRAERAEKAGRDGNARNGREARPQSREGSQTGKPDPYQSTLEAVRQLEERRIAAAVEATYGVSAPAEPAPTEPAPAEPAPTQAPATRSIDLPKI